VVQNLGLRSDSQLLACQGKLDGLTVVVEDLKKRMVLEEVKQQVVLSSESRPEGVHPGPSIKELRTEDTPPNGTPLAKKRKKSRP